ncbi:nudix hydrolase 3-like isoform X2 [Sesamum indicum]|uniref:Nudix hydrolase 3-like isoform X2 n=1 Tax=Sesamum indicum TaxID=4182 RepID=A0A8M8UWM6_SESIN|nr:nudix hydrolase 3-like isoform X2 [Sesamum indicum]
MHQVQKSQVMAASPELLDVLSKDGQKTGISKPRGDVHRDGDYHRAVRVLIFAENTQQMLLQKRTDCKEAWAGLWDISTSGHISAGSSSLATASGRHNSADNLGLCHEDRRELHEEIGIKLPSDAFEFMFSYLEQSVTNDGKYVNNEYNDVYLITTLDPIPLDAFTLQESEVSGMKYLFWEDYRRLLAEGDPGFVPYDVNGQYGTLFEIISERYKGNVEERAMVLEKQLNRYCHLTGLADADKEALGLLIKTAKIMDEIFSQQVWCSNPCLRDWLREHADESRLDKLKWMYYQINGTPWSALDENEPFLSTADSAIKLLPDATKPVNGWKGLEYRAAFPLSRPHGANFYPRDMEKREFELWNDSLSDDQKMQATGSFHTVRRQSEGMLDDAVFLSNDITNSYVHDLYSNPYSQEYQSLLAEAADLLYKAGNLSSSPSLTRFLHSNADAFESNDYHESHIAWTELDSKLDITIGPYETHRDTPPQYKATFKAIIGIRDDEAACKVKLFADNFQVLDKNLPIDEAYKSNVTNAATIRVVNLVYRAGSEPTEHIHVKTPKKHVTSLFCQDLKGTTSVSFDLPNDQRLTLLLKNVAKAKFKLLFQPITNVCVSEEQRGLLDFESLYTHVICREYCRALGPHAITLGNGQKSSVRMEMQELHSALEEAKASIVGLWAIRFLTDKDLLPEKLIKPMYVSFLTGCFHSLRFGLKKAHIQAQALLFNYLSEKGGIVLLPDETFYVDFDKVENGVESLSREILTVQGRGDKAAAKSLLDKYSVISQPLRGALKKLEMLQVPVDIAPAFPIWPEMN